MKIDVLKELREKLNKEIKNLDLRIQNNWTKIAVLNYRIQKYENK